MIRADLHMHSYYSDGMLSPAELVKRQKKADLKIVALTDHNSVKGVDEVLRAGKKLGIRVIPAVEMTGKEGEVLVYFINPRSGELKKFIRRCADHEQEKARLLFKILRAKGSDVSYKDLQRTFPMANNNYNLGHFKTYLRVKGWTEEQIRRIIQKKKVKVNIRNPKNKKVSFREIISFSNKIGGVPVIAHPWFSKQLLFNEKAMKALIRAGLKGIELDNGDRNLWGRDAKLVRKVRYYARKYNLILTKGTDHHALNWMKGKGHSIGNTFCSEQVVKQLEMLKPDNA